MGQKLSREQGASFSKDVLGTSLRYPLASLPHLGGTHFLIQKNANWGKNLSWLTINEDDDASTDTQQSKYSMSWSDDYECASWGSWPNEIVVKIWSGSTEEERTQLNSIFAGKWHEPDHMSLGEYLDELHIHASKRLNPCEDMLTSSEWSSLPRLDPQFPEKHLICRLLSLLYTPGSPQLGLQPVERETSFSPAPNEAVFPENMEFSEGTKQVHPLQLRSRLHHGPLLLGAAADNNTKTIFLFFKRLNYTLQQVLRFKKEMVTCQPAKARFILYQLMRTLSSLHASGIGHGNLSLSNCLITKDMWMQLSGLRLVQIPRNIDDEHPTIRWINGQLSNFDYLMVLNGLAGRRWGDALYHPIFPWVIDFESATGRWRDLKKTKYRLLHGDEQLDTTYRGPHPHHVTESLSDLTLMMYLARITPKEVLQRVVRSNFEPNEYPNSIVRMYKWSPDECIPEFFCDASVFKSIHADMEDLSLPQWALSPQDFIDKHRAALESRHVSERLHHWIDLSFGYKLKGEPAVEAKNVPLSNDNQQDIGAPPYTGFVQLFKTPHPQRIALPEEPDDDIYRHQSSVTDEPDEWETIHDESRVRFLAKRGKDASRMTNDNNIDGAVVLPTFVSPNSVVEGIVKVEDQFSLSKFVALSKSPKGSTDESSNIEANIDNPTKFSFSRCMIADLQDVASIAEKLHDIAADNDEGWVNDADSISLRKFIHMCRNPDLNQSPDEFIHELLRCSLFPDYFVVLHHLLSLLHAHNCTDDARLDQYLPKLLTLPPQAFQIALPFFLTLFRKGHRLRLRAFEKLLVPVAEAVGPLRANSELLPILCEVLEDRDDSVPAAVMSNPDAIISWIRVFGEHSIVENVFPILISLLRRTDTCVSGRATGMISVLSSCVVDSILVPNMILPLLSFIGKSRFSSCCAAIVGLSNELSEGTIAHHIVIPTSQFISENEPETIHDALQVYNGVLNVFSQQSVLRYFVLEPTVLLNWLSPPPPIAHTKSIKLLASTIVRVCNAIGAEDTKKHVSAGLQSFFNHFQGMLPILAEASKEQIDKALGDTEAVQAIPEVLMLVYVPLCALLGRTTLQTIIPSCVNLVEVVLFKFFQWKPDLRCSSSAAPDWAHHQSRHHDQLPPPNTVMVNQYRKGSESARRASVGSVDSGDEVKIRSGRLRWTLGCQVARTFKGHTGTVRLLCSSSKEELFMSCGKDMSVRLWRLGEMNHVGGYGGHKEQVHTAFFVGENSNMCCSADSDIHIWDTATTTLIHKFKGSSAFSSCTSFSRVGKGHLGKMCSDHVLVGLFDSGMRLFDLRTSQNNHKGVDWKFPSGALGIGVRAATTSPDGNWVAIGLATGQVLTMDTRIGIVHHLSRLHDGIINKMVALSCESFASASQDRSVAISKVGLLHPRTLGDEINKPATITHLYDGFPEGVIDIASAGNCIVSTTGTHLGFANVDDGELVLRRPRDIKCKMMAVSVLEHSRLLLVACDDGQIRALN